MQQILPLSKYLPIGRNIDFERWFTTPLTNAESPALTVYNKGNCPRRDMGGPTSASYQNNYQPWNLWSVAEKGRRYGKFLDNHPYIYTFTLEIVQRGMWLNKRTGIQ